LEISHAVFTSVMEAGVGGGYRLTV